MSSSEYYLSLSGDVKLRYGKKLEKIDNVDPYTLTPSEPCLDLSLFPKVTIVDIMNYLILTHSYYTGQQLKAYKSLEAYKYFEAGFVQQVFGRKFNDCYVVVAKVLHSQRRREKPLQVWVILLEDGSISTGHCTCMAGLGEVCSHTAALLFLLEARPAVDLDGNQAACTDVLARWPVPTVKNVSMVRIRDMNWAKPSKPVSRSTLSVTPMQNEELVDLIESLQGMGIQPALTRNTEPFANRMQPPVSNLPVSFECFFNPSFLEKSYEDILKISNSLSMKLTIEEIREVEKLTREQSQSTMWLRYRAGRITASKLKKTSRARIVKPSLSLIKGICYPESVVFYSKQTNYGINNEKKALAAYLKEREESHQGVELKNVGFWISEKQQEVGASPDGLVFCKCCGPGCVEVMCPYLLSKFCLKDYIDLKSSCVVRKGDEYILNQNHEYYFQVQLQMYATGLKYCDFVIWSKDVLIIDRVLYDNEFLESNLEKSLNFHRHVIMSELIGKYFTRQEGFAKITMWCICSKPDDGRPMIQCDNNECVIQWFHFDCMNILEPPEDIWFCVNCNDCAV